MHDLDLALHARAELHLLAHVAGDDGGGAAEDGQVGAGADGLCDFSRPEIAAGDAAPVDPDRYPGSFERIGDGQGPLTVCGGIT